MTATFIWIYFDLQDAYGSGWVDFYLGLIIRSGEQWSPGVRIQDLN